MRRPEVPITARQLTYPVLVALLTLIALMSWGLSSPVGSSPDDDFHLASIWCGQGDNNSGCESAPSETERVVARDLVIDSVCFAFTPNTSASCQGEDFGVKPGDTVQTPRGNFTGVYPPLYYYVMNFLTGDNIENSVLAMKLLNCLIFVGLVAALFWLLPLHRRQTLVWSLAISLVPLGMFIIPSTNPSSWAVISAGTLWLALVGYFESEGRRRIGLAVIAALAAVLGAGARADSALFAGLAIALAMVVTFRTTQRWFRSAILPLALVLIAVAFFFSAQQAEAISGGLTPGQESTANNPVTLTMANLINLPTLWVGVFGFTGLGWLDTQMPAGVWFAGLTVFSGALFIGMTTHVPRKAVVVSTLVAALIVMPTLLLVQSSSAVGTNVQPRYMLPLVVMLAGLLLLQSVDSRIVIRRTQKWFVLLVLSLSNTIALHTNMRRYVTGADVSSINLDSGTEWWWDIPFSPMFVWIVGSLAFAGVLVAVNAKLSNSPMGGKP
ncbi:MAG: DUF2142 domain-containing protein [Rhodoglobus sp.]